MLHALAMPEPSGHLTQGPLSNRQGKKQCVLGYRPDKSGSNTQVYRAHAMLDKVRNAPSQAR